MPLDRRVISPHGHLFDPRLKFPLVPSRAFSSTGTPTKCQARDKETLLATNQLRSIAAMLTLPHISYRVEVQKKKRSIQPV